MRWVRLTKHERESKQPFGERVPAVGNTQAQILRKFELCRKLSSITNCLSLDHYPTDDCACFQLIERAADLHQRPRLDRYWLQFAFSGERHDRFQLS